MEIAMEINSLRAFSLRIYLLLLIFLFTIVLFSCDINDNATDIFYGSFTITIIAYRGLQIWSMKWVILAKDTNGFKYLFSVQIYLKGDKYIQSRRLNNAHYKLSKSGNKQRPLSWKSHEYTRYDRLDLAIWFWLSLFIKRVTIILSCCFP